MPSPGIQACRPDCRAHGIMVMRDEVPKSSPIEPNDAEMIRLILKSSKSHRAADQTLIAQFLCNIFDMDSCAKSD